MQYENRDHILAPIGPVRPKISPVMLLPWHNHADSDRKRPQSDDPQPQPACDAVSPSKRSGSHANQNDNVGDVSDDRRVFSLALRDNVKKAHPSPAKNDSDSDDDDYTSSSGSDSDEDDEVNHEEDDQDHDVKSDNGSDHTLPRIPAPQKPQIHRIERNPDLFSRLSAFLPQMKSANDKLQEEIEAGRGKDLRLDEVDDQTDDQYIEMNLGLGVLEEKRPADGVAPSAKSEGPAYSHAESHSNASPESNLLETLMGNKDTTSSKKPTIEEMNE
ncbi:hypothetical protein ABOM_004978 [Aspergillus bombycis]|uniref:Uncharacterized protein n=1 Tax=Aspergillus bombycis TaxID=109264 RepID=A0A1F8A507_9EURO|nr:hypothetical protein ABOM_004978 [Aspergillus bombycis]OGM46787.1 hypothetical protein ABOM_004978 [Aspergillus bombycis]